MSKVKFVEPIINENWFVFVAPDGSMQLMTLATDYAMCIAIARLLHKQGIGQSVHEMKLKGFTVEMVNLNVSPSNTPIAQIGTPENW